jgi:hypothetical protein
VEKGSENLPGDVQLVVSDKVAVIPLERIENQSPAHAHQFPLVAVEAWYSLVRLGNLEITEPPLVRQIHLGRYGPHLQPGRLGVHLEVHGFSWLDTDDELVARNLLEDALRHILVLDADLRLPFVESCRTSSVPIYERSGRWTHPFQP